MGRGGRRGGDRRERAPTGQARKGGDDGTRQTQGKAWDAEI